MKPYKEWRIEEERKFGVYELLDRSINQLQDIKKSWEHVDLPDRGKLQQLQHLYKQYGQAVEQLVDQLINTEPEPEQEPENRIDIRKPGWSTEFFDDLKKDR